jgi:hypothetical protein
MSGLSVCRGAKARGMKRGHEPHPEEVHVL